MANILIGRASMPGVLAFALLLAACGSEPVGDHTELVVSAASSLTDAFVEIEKAFESEYADIDVRLNLGGSSALREQIIEGAPADVFASADISNMDQIVDAGEAAGAPVIFARNLLQVAVPSGNPAGVVGLADLARDDLLIGLCAEEVPCGDLARLALENAGVSAIVDTNEPDVRALLTKIEAGELDAGITYVTDVGSSDGVEGVDIPVDVNVAATYPIVALAGAGDPDAANLFVAFVLSDRGRAILHDHGFAYP